MKNDKTMTTRDTDAAKAGEKPILWNTAYPGSMSEKRDGLYVRADDESSLAASLLAMIAKLKQENGQYKTDYIAPYIVDELRSALIAARECVNAHEDPEGRKPYKLLDQIDSALAKAKAKGEGDE